jgi:hypothetical protein
MVPAATSASRHASVTTVASPSWLGAAMLAARNPLWLTAMPFSTARTLSPSATASDSGFSTRTPPPSPAARPLASASNGRHRPSADSRPCIGSHSELLISRGKTLTPPTTASGTSRPRSCRTAMLSAVSPLLHAVSTTSAGPRRSNR